MVRMMIESEPTRKFIDLSDEMTESFLKYTGVPQYRKLCFAVHELVINAVEASLSQYGCSGAYGACGAEEQSPSLADRSGELKAAGSGCTISLKMELVESDIVITISNRAEPSAVQRLHSMRGMTLDDLLHEERGRGLLIAKRLSDELTFDQDERGQITIELRKRRRRWA
ncbi:hypothetical protein SK3146_05185 [Paenibacillus konkukensis]|uniref:Histidine kinase/HSP90-like ATPase domain-containing protein n=1 Tax=Paenibacillus konkukensis TaxID=2020716 RepID=A0ABY4RVU9_9BACL|nr:ATP-binding protein [Paenibacillus konkukensis]UQZ85895.1 hypothetical protein SK3146_05185 [Paenibacillus konkukensis]